MTTQERPTWKILTHFEVKSIRVYMEKTGVKQAGTCPWKNPLQMNDFTFRRFIRRRMKLPKAVLSEELRKEISDHHTCGTSEPTREADVNEFNALKMLSYSVVYSGQVKEKNIILYIWHCNCEISKRKRRIFTFKIGRVLRKSSSQQSVTQST